MKIWMMLLALVCLFNGHTFAGEDIMGECREIVKSSCGSKDLVTCMKSSSKHKEFETCLGILLTDAGAPEQVQPLQAEKLFDASKANCFTILSQNCGGMEPGECISKKGNLFPEGCRVLYSEINEQQERMKAISGHCFKNKLTSCNEKHDLNLMSYTAFMAGLKQVEQCISGGLLNDSQCVSQIEAEAKERRLAAEEEKKKLEEQALSDKKESDEG